MRDELTMNELYPLIEETIAGGGTFRFYPRGISMLPMLEPGKDSIELSQADTVETGDVLFYRRDNGVFVLHRLIEKRGDTYTMCGDHQWALEYGIRPDQVLAKLVGFYKEDVYHSVDEPEYLAYQKKMVKRFRFYRRNPTIYAFLRKMKRIFKK